MSGIVKHLTAVAVLGFAALFTFVGVSLSTAADAKAPDLSDLRDAVKTASKRGGNVDEVKKALGALEKYLDESWTEPKEGSKTPTPAELTAVRNAVEEAGKKGENVEEIRKQLDLVERAMIGKSLAPPKPVPVPEPARPNPNPFGQPGLQGFPGIPEFAPGIDMDEFNKATEALIKAREALVRNPHDPAVRKMQNEAINRLQKSLGGGGGFGIGGLGGLGGLDGIPPGLLMPNMLNAPDLPRGPERYRLGIKMERISDVTAEQLGLENRGVAIIGVVPGTAADKAGFKVNDIVIEFAGKPVSDNIEAMTRMVNEVKAGEKVDAVILRKGKKVEIKGIDLPATPQPVGIRARAVQLPRAGLPDVKPLPSPVNVRGEAMSVTVTNDEYTVDAKQGGVKYTLTGTLGENGAEFGKAVIEDGGKTHTAEKLDKVPQDYRATVEKLLKSVGSGSIIIRQ